MLRDGQNKQTKKYHCPKAPPPLPPHPDILHKILFTIKSFLAKILQPWVITTKHSKPFRGKGTRECFFCFGFFLREKERTFPLCLQTPHSWKLKSLKSKKVSHSLKQSWIRFQWHDPSRRWQFQLNDVCCLWERRLCTDGSQDGTESRSKA